MSDDEALEQLAGSRSLYAHEHGPLSRARAALRRETKMEEHIMQFFAYAHLSPAMQAVSKPFCDLARRMVDGEASEDGTVLVAPLPRNPERTVALRKLLEAKDAAVRAFIAKP
jgi:hypothetical protein